MVISYICGGQVLLSIGRVNLSNARPKDRLLKIDLLKPGSMSYSQIRTRMVAVVLARDRYHIRTYARARGRSGIRPW